jgi:methionyl-tRNA formyltransferase
MKILFFGTPEFSIPSLTMLVEGGHEVLGVVTQPDKPKGRSLKLESPPVKVLALGKGIPVFQPASLKKDDFAGKVRGLKPDVIVVVAYGKILPAKILDILPDRIINIHPSLLPAFRGAAPINWAVIRGETRTGVTSMLLDEGMDTGKILLARSMPIEPEDDAVTLSEKLAVLGAAVLSDTLKAIREGKLEPSAQDDSRATYAPMLKKEDGSIDWQETSSQIHNLRRGLSPWPGAMTFLKQGKRVILGATRVGESDLLAMEPPGTVQRLSEHSLVVRCGGATTLLVDALKPEGRNFMSGKEFLNGRYIGIGESFEPPPTIPEPEKR